MAAQAIKVFEYNTHLYGDTIDFLKGILAYQDKLRARDICRRLLTCGADIVGLCELWDPILALNYPDGVAYSVREVYPYFYYPQTRIVLPKVLGSGLLLLSKWPLSNMSFVGYKKLAGLDALSTKGMACATVQPPQGNAFNVFLTHTQADTYETERQDNISQLAQWIQQHQASSNAPVFSFGDFNVIGEETNGVPSAEYKATMAKLSPCGLSDSCRIVYPDAGRHHEYTYDGLTNTLIPIFAPGDKNAQQRLDYLFSGVGFKPTSYATVLDYKFVVDGKTMDLSDHYPCQGGFELS